MKITEKLTLNPDHILGSDLAQDEKTIWIMSAKDGGDISYSDEHNGEGFAKKTHERITAYFEMKERKLFDCWEAIPTKEMNK